MSIGVDAGRGTNNSNLLPNLEAKCKLPPAKTPFPDKWLPYPHQRLPDLTLRNFTHATTGKSLALRL